MTSQETLPRGPHKLSADEVRGSQRRRACDAVIELAAERGLRNVTVSDVVGAARISKSSFYAMFDSLEDAFLSAGGALIDAMFKGMLESASTAETPMGAMVASNDFALGFVRQHRAFAVAGLVELTSLGAKGAPLREQMHEACRTAFELTADWFRREDPSLPPVPPGMARAVAAGSLELLGSAALADTEASYADTAQAVFSLWLMGTTGTVSHSG